MQQRANLVQMTGLPRAATVHDVRSFFGTVRAPVHVRGVFRMLQRSGRGTGTAWVDFAAERDARVAIVTPAPHRPPLPWLDAGWPPSCVMIY